VNDEELGEVLRALLAAADPVPQASLQAAYESIGWRDPDSELALLDSEPALQPTYLRGRPSRLLTFRTGGIVIDLEVSEADSSTLPSQSRSPCSRPAGRAPCGLTARGGSPSTACPMAGCAS